MAEAVEGTEQADVVSSLEHGPRESVQEDEWVSDTKGEGEGEDSPPAENEQSTAQNAQAPAPSEKPDPPEQVLSKRATSASDDSGDLVALVRGMKSGGVSEDRMVRSAEAVGAFFSAPGGLSVRENAAVVIEELERAGLDVGKMLVEVAAASAQDDAEVVARELQDGLKNVLSLVHRKAAATSARIDVHMKNLDARAQGVLTSAMLAQTMLDKLESNVRKMVSRFDDVQRGVESLDSVLRTVRVEVEGAAKARESLVENAGVIGRGVWWWALVGGVFGGMLIGVFAGLVLRVVAGL